ncbi:hypothetical protein LUZ60_008755 [Juncus effusus]|nr:hypothetical protein LUZ60_008755 [Juncus effusus]
MSQKRQPEEGKEGSEESFPGEKRQKIPALRGIIKEVIKTENVRKFFSALEPLLRKVVKEEVELALANHATNIARQNIRDEISPNSSISSPSFSQNLQLKFTNKLSLPIFTNAKIDAQDSSPLSLSLFDSFTNSKITQNPNFSTLKIEIVVLEGDFDSENWTVEEFKSFLVREREGRKPLLNGDVFLELECGLGFVGDLSFTDNSSWTRSRKFRLGARIEEGFCNGIRVREAVSEAFMVKDHRGELYKKHHPPYLEDEVWRLEKIGKDGAFHKRLRRESIITVQDFLILFHTDPTRLRNILGNGMSAKMWDSVVDHARTCVLTDRVHVHQQPIKRSGVVFNVVGELKGVLNERGSFVPIEELSEKETAEAHASAETAYKNWENVETFESINSIPTKTLINPFSPMSPPTNQFGLNISSPDIFALGSLKDPNLLEPSLLDESTSGAFYDANCLSYVDSNFDSSDLGLALRGFLGSPMEISHTKAYKVGWRTVSLVWGLIFYIKKSVAKKKKGKERLC